MNVLISQLLTLAIIIALGIILAKLNILTNETRKNLSSMLVYVIAPLYTIKSFQIEFSRDILKSMGIVAAVALFTISFGLVVGRILWYKKDDKKSHVLTFANGFMNCSFIGYPLLYSLFGDTGIIYGSMFVLVFQCILWTAGVIIFTGHSKKWYLVFLQPGMVGILIGLVLFIAKIKLPVFLYNSFNMVGSMTPPLAMLIIGAFLSEVDIIHSLKDFKTYAVAFFRLIVAPAIILLILTLLGFSPDNGIFFTCTILLAGMPVATTAVLFATNFDSDAKYASSIVAISTVLSAITIPVWLYIISLL